MKTIPAKAGMNRFAWDLRYDDPVQTPGAFYAGEPPRGPVVFPGDYQVKLTVKGQWQQTAPLHVVIDPREKDAGDGIQQAVALGLQVRDRISQLHQAINEIRETKTQIESLQKRFAENDKVKPALAAAADLEKKMSEIEGVLMQVKMKSSEGNLVYPNELNEELYTFGGMIDADAAPTQPQQEVFKKLSSRLDEQLQKWAALKQQEVPKVNDMIKQADIPALTVQRWQAIRWRQTGASQFANDVGRRFRLPQARNLAVKTSWARRSARQTGQLCQKKGFGKRSAAFSLTMSHSHEHEIDFGRAFAIGVLLNSAFIVAEVVFGLFSHSLTLLADAGHNLGDVLGLLIAWAATALQRLNPTKRYTYGLRRTSVLAALCNAILLLVGVGAIGWEAIRRLHDPGQVAGLTMIWVAAVGVVINGVTAWMFAGGRTARPQYSGRFRAHGGGRGGLRRGRRRRIRHPAHWLGVARSDQQSRHRYSYSYHDLGAAARFDQSSLDAVPRGIDPGAVQDFLEQLPGVAEIHHLHVWGLSTTETACTAHVVKREPLLDDELLKRISRELHDRFQIAHTTIQFECCDPPDCPTEHDAHNTRIHEHGDQQGSPPRRRSRHAHARAD